ncbi:hypothetical protein SME17J_44270 [Serratia marcescens]|nr:hypothetical protein SME17J_44270 [Serratia marcescens]
MAGFSLSGVRTLHRTAFDYSAKGLTLRASAKALFNTAPAPVVRVRAPYSEEPAYGGFLLFRDWTLHRTAFDYSAKGLTLRAGAEALFNTAPAPVVRVRSPYSEEPAYGGFFAFWRTDSPSNCVRLFGLKASPCGPALKRCSTRHQRHRANVPLLLGPLPHTNVGFKDNRVTVFSALA